MEFSKPDAFAKQIAIYFKDGQNQKAYDLAKEFAMKYPGELLPRVLVAEAAFRMGRFAEAKIEGYKALRYATSESDLVFCTLVYSSACFQLKDYIEGYDTLKRSSKGKFIEGIEEALLIFSIAMDDEQKALRHMKNLIVLNREKALEFMKMYASHLPQK